ncbi:hypothetical protein B9Z55_016419 [Caenorhabditis nigoni]|uniref:C-type lectin domain-containing protein n=1 Tax=Caenorhabditis nigoni TaxID=1611254 RepID=A0A2G5T516_9PELO|nr:hypothetical protein B9Z55_016419 [Caenorhabditis nigoni]
MFNYPEAQSYCESMNSIVTGLETTEERDFIANTGVANLGSDYPQFAGFWVSGVRKSECYAERWESISFCTGIDMQQFTFSDNYLTNYAGYTWDQDQPNRDKVGVWQNCIQMWIRNAAKFPNNVNETLANGNVDDAVCEESYYESYQMRGFACGKVAENPDGAM